MTDNEWYERERAAFIAWWESGGQEKFGATPTLAAGAGWLAKAEAVRPEERQTIEHLQMQIGYLATALMVKGDKRSLPEIIEEAERATSSRPQKERTPE